MKKLLLSIALLSGLSICSFAQRTPQASPSATVLQTVGVSDFSVKYSRPSIKGRSVFSDNSTLAPYGQLWRTGANAATTLESGTEFWFGDRQVPAGKYALLTIPSGGAWTVILNKNPNQGTADYDQNNEAARISVAPSSSEFTESFTIDFSDVTDSTALLNISWSSVKIPVALSVKTQELTLYGLNKAVAEKPEDQNVLQATSGYLLSKNKDLPLALSLADKSIGLKENFTNLWLKAQILSKLGKFKEALPLAQKALTVGASSGEPSFAFYKTQIEKGITDIQAKLAATVPAVPAKGKKKK